MVGAVDICDGQCGYCDGPLQINQCMGNTENDYTQIHSHSAYFYFNFSFSHKHVPLIDTKLAWHSVAMALASKVLPHPGGP